MRSHLTHVTIEGKKLNIIGTSNILKIRDSFQSQLYKNMFFFFMCNDWDTEGNCFRLKNIANSYRGTL